MRSPIKRISLIAFFFGLNVVLGSYFLSQFHYPLPVFATQFLSHFNLIPANYDSSETYSLPKNPDLSKNGVLDAVNAIRQQENISNLNENKQLTEAAEELLNEYRKKNFKIDDVDEQALERSLKNSGYKYAWVGNNIFVGPLYNSQISEALLHDEDQLKTIKNADFSQIGIATSIEKLYGSDIGIVVQLLGQPQQKAKKAVTQASGTITTKTTGSATQIPDQEVITALNSYRAVHGVAPLQVDANLCIYAEKRAKDLVAFGSLDSHAGFKKDFENPENPPIGIKEYPGTSIGENLAHQFCKNMTTGESFVAQTGTALIEWCFDSSTKGHKEAQLSTEFKNVCVRHGNNMYVVIFGS